MEIPTNSTQRTTYQMAKGHPAGKVPVLRNAMVDNARTDIMGYDNDLFSRSCLQRAARGKRKKKPVS